MRPPQSKVGIHIYCIHSHSPRQRWFWGVLNRFYCKISQQFYTRLQLCIGSLHSNPLWLFWAFANEIKFQLVMLVVATERKQYLGTGTQCKVSLNGPSSNHIYHVFFYLHWSRRNVEVLQCGMIFSCNSKIRLFFVFSKNGHFKIVFFWKEG